MSTPANPASVSPNKWYDNTLLVVALLLLFFPVGLYALFMNRRLGVIGKFMVCGAIMFLGASLVVLAGVGVFWFMRSSPEGQKSLQAMLGKYAPNSDNTKNPDILVSTLTTPSTTTPPLIKGETDPIKAESVPIPPVQPIQPPSVPTPVSPTTPNATSAADEAARIKAIQDKARADAEAFDKANAGLAAKELDRAANEVKNDAALLTTIRQKMSTEYEQIFNGFVATSDPAVLSRDLEAQFKAKGQDLNSLTPEFLRDYNSSLSQRREELRQAFAALDANDGRVKQFEDRVAQKTDDVNQRLAAAGKPTLPPVQADPGLDAHIAEIKTRFATLPSRPLTLADVQNFIPRSPSVAVAPPSRNPARVDPPEVPLEPVLPNRPVTPNNPFTPRNPNVTNVTPPPYTPPQPSTPQPTYPQPRNTQPLPPAPAPAVDGALTVADISGGWRRGDGKVSWVFDTGGAMSANASGIRRAGSWTFDDKTAKLTVSLNNVVYTFTVTKVKDQLSMEGGVPGAGQLRFSKVSKY